MEIPGINGKPWWKTKHIYIRWLNVVSSHSWIWESFIPKMLALVFFSEIKSRKWNSWLFTGLLYISYLSLLYSLLRPFVRYYQHPSKWLARRIFSNRLRPYMSCILQFLGHKQGENISKVLEQSSKFLLSVGIYMKPICFSRRIFLKFLSPLL